MFCLCGCGSPTSVIQKTDRSRGYVKGQHMRYLIGHKKHSLETRTKMSMSHKGLVRTEEHRHNLSIARRAVMGDMRGENSPRWKGGITPENRRVRTSTAYAQWRRDVFERDNYTCQHCGVRGGNLHAHHIKSFKDHIELRLVVDNGLTLCEEDHKATHRGEI